MTNIVLQLNCHISGNFIGVHFQLRDVVIEELEAIPVISRTFALDVQCNSRPCLQSFESRERVFII